MKFDSTLQYALRTLLKLVWVAFFSVAVIFCLIWIPDGQGDDLRAILTCALIIFGLYTLVVLCIFLYRWQWATVKNGKIIFRCALFPLAKIRISDIRYVHFEKICALKGRNPFKYLTDWMTIETDPEHKNLHHDSGYNAWGQDYQAVLATQFNVALLRQIYQEETGGDSLPLVPYY